MTASDMRQSIPDIAADLTNGGSGNVLYRRVVRAATGHDLLAFDL